MKKTIFLTTFLLVTILSFSQSGGFAKGDKQLNIGVGVNSGYDNGIPFGASFEVGITDAISVGGNFDYLSSDFGNAFGDFKFTALYFGARGSYHFNELFEIENEKIDVYAGATVGYRSFSWDDDFNDSLGDDYDSALFVGIYAGARYYFTDSIGAFLEVGDIGSTNARLGVTFKF